MILEKIRGKNFFSIGNAFFEIDLQRYDKAVIGGRNGSGKCLRGPTAIEVEIYEEEARAQFIEFMKNRNDTIDCTVLDIVEFYENFPQYKGKIFANSRHGFKKVEEAACTLKSSKWLSITTNSGKNVECSKDHRLWSENEWIYAKNLKIGDFLLTKDGYESVVSIHESVDAEDLYDLQIEDVHEFYANGFVSHNSSIGSLITFALFGQTIKNVTKNQIVNSINGKGCVVEIELTCSIGKKYLIRRGIKPTIFEIYENGELINQTSANEYQEYLEKNVLRVSYRTFMQTTILSVENYKPFMTLRAWERRQFVEDILDIRVFTFMNQVCKQRLTKAKDELKLIDVQLKSAKQRALMQKNHIDKLQQLIDSGVDVLKTKFAENQKQQTDISFSNGLLKTELRELNTLFSKTKDNYDRSVNLKNELSPLQRTLIKLQRDLSHYDDHDTCHTCKQTVSTDEIKNKIKHDISIESAKIEYITKELEEYAGIEDLYEEQYNKRKKLGESIVSNERTIELLETQNEKFQSEIADTNNGDEISVMKDDLRTLAAEAMELRNRQSELNTDIGYYDVMIELFKDTGIKSKIVSQYIPIINQTVNACLEKFDFFVSFELDENFNEVIKSRHRDTFSYDSFSAGEKQRIDLAMMFSFRHLAAIRNSLDCNLLFLDEILDSSLDTTGIQNLLTMFEDMKNSNIVVISHRNKELFEEFFSGSYEVYKEMGFTQIRDQNQLKS
jgi:hypothetical protein